MIWRWLGLFVATLSLTWLALLWRLQNRSDIPEGVLWVYFAGLPLLVFALLAGFIWAFRRAYAASQKKQDARAGEVDASSHTASEVNTGAAQVSASALKVSVLFAGARNMAGAQAAEILDGLREGKLFPAPDAELLNWAGMPVVTARIAGLEAEFETLAPAFSETGSDTSSSDDVDTPAYVLRSAAALQPLLHEAFAAVGQLPGSDEANAAAKEEDASTYHSALLRPAREQGGRTVHVLAAVDEAWPAQSVQGFRHWLEQAVQMQSQQAACAASFELVHGGGALWHAARDFVRARQAQQVNADGTAVQPPLYLMLLASHSDLDEEWVAFYENKGILFSAQDNPRGQIPGEAAAALLLSVGGRVAHEPNHEATVGPVLYWPEVSCKTNAAHAEGANSAAGGASSGLLADGMQIALRAAGVAAEDVACLCSDSDRHSCQATELLGMTWTVLPQLDPLEHMGMAGVSGGNMGAASSLLACALAVEAASQRHAPCAFASVQDEQLRVAGCVAPQGWSG